jgi:hypothetical protein
MNSQQTLLDLGRVISSEDNSRTNSLTFALGIGAQRSGTSWISKYLENHPDFMMPSIKELHVFDSISLRKNSLIEERFADQLMMKKSKDMSPNNRDAYTTLADRVALTRINGGYYKFFNKRLKRDHRAFGEITPEYALLDSEAYKLIYESHPDIRFFFILRDPAERYLSALNYWSRLRPRFSAHENRISGLSRLLFTRYSMYHLTLERLFKYVPRSKVLVLFSEEIFADPETWLNILCRHIGIATSSTQTISALASNRINQSPSKSVPIPSDIERDIIRQHFASVYQSLPSLIEKPIPNKWINPS